MKVQEHIDKISWSVADKFLYVIYGVVTLFQMKALDPNEYGLYGLLINLHTWVFIAGDAFLSNVIQFGMNKENRQKANTYSLILITAFTMSIALIVFIFNPVISSVFKLPRFSEIALVLPVLSLIFIPRVFCIKLIFRDSDMKKLFFVNFAFFFTLSAITVFLIATRGMLTFKSMVYMYLIGSTVSSLIAVIITRKKMEFGFKGNISIKRMLSFDLPLMFIGAINALPKQLDIYIIQYFFSTSVVGIYFSAKSLFRFFEESAGAALGLVYPAAVRQLEHKNYKGLNDLMTKSVSFLFVSFIIIVIILESGVSNFLITAFLPVKYHLAVGQFNLLILASVGLPFVVLSSIINAAEKPLKLFVFILTAFVFSVITFYLVGISGNQNLIPLGQIAYILILGSLCFLYIKRNFGFKISQLFRSVNDTYSYLKQRFSKS
ncbi:MAG: oligosaccharide flippase family protein [Bacteroidota bacterium]